MFSFRNLNNVVRSSCLRHLSREAFRDLRGEQFSLTKIVGTIGPKSEESTVLQSCTNAGLRIMRINFSHATYDEADLRIKNLRKCIGVHGNQFNLRSILLDTQGPEIRTGELSNHEILLQKGDTLVLTTDSSYQDKGSQDKVFITYSNLPSTVKKGDSILLDDGLIHLSVLEANSTEVKCQVQNNGQLGDRKGVNLPGLVVDLPALTEKDKKDIEYGIQNDIDFIAASFVRKPKDVREIRNFVDSMMKKYWPQDYPAPKIISKIENYEGVLNFEEILSESDGIMVARGDLGVEIPLQKVLTCQKMMVDRCNQVGKPVIVATQMLESMIKNPRPTRAEVSDVGNAVFDGADAVMLSGEVAKGKYPVESISTMMTIIKEADRFLEANPKVSKGSVPTNDVESVASSAVKTAHDINAKLIIIMTQTGYTARKIAKYSPNVPVMCYASCRKVGRQLQLHRALYPIVNGDQEKIPTPIEAIRHASELGWLQIGDKAILIHADELTSELGNQLVTRVLEVKKEMFQ